jgi:hypothetical protein
VTFRVKYLMGGVIRGIGVRRVDFPNLGVQIDKNQAIMCFGDITLMAPSLPPVMSSRSRGSALRAMIDERTIPECAFHEAVQSKVSEYL